MPVNWRELAGAARILEQWGPRLAGRLLVIETDNMASMYSIRKGHSRTRMMAEMLRRLYTMAAKWRVRIRIMHTRGVDLVLPDAVSRKRDPVPPRQRLIREEYERVSREWGPYGEGIGAEIEHPVYSPEAGSDAMKVWYHPSHDCIADTLKLM